MAERTKRRRSRRRSRSQRRRRNRRTLRGGAREPVIIGHWNGAPLDDRCQTLVYRPTGDDREGSPYYLASACDTAMKEGTGAPA